ncbi:hypothetical protein ERS070196_02399, partial [Streptococcus pneumoniae]
MTGVSNPTTDSARLVLAEAKKALADDSLTEQDLRPNHSYLSQLDVTYKTPDLM